VGDVKNRVDPPQGLAVKLHPGPHPSTFHMTAFRDQSRERNENIMILWIGGKFILSVHKFFLISVSTVPNNHACLVFSFLNWLILGMAITFH
jgi:hypothetical protein